MSILPYVSFKSNSKFFKQTKCKRDQFTHMVHISHHFRKFGTNFPIFFYRLTFPPNYFKILKYKPIDEGGTCSPPAMSHRLQHLTASLIQNWQWRDISGSVLFCKYATFRPGLPPIQTWCTCNISLNNTGRGIILDWGASTSFTLDHQNRVLLYSPYLKQNNCWGRKLDLKCPTIDWVINI